MRLPPAEPSTSALPAMVEDPLHPHIIPLHASCATHGWGSHGDSLAARLHSLNRNTSLNLDQPYSEFVIASIDPYQATLANAPSVTLSSHIQQQVIEVDPAILEFYASLHEHGVPYVLKVLSVCSPQPLRVHPNQKNAKRLAESFNFKFPFARPVLLVAISRAEALFGFQSCEDIVSELSRVPEFADCIGRPVTDHYVHIVKTAIPNPSHIRELITSLLSRGPEVITDCLVRASKRLLKMPKDSVTENDRDLIAMQTKFPNDPMCFAVYFLNRVVLEPGSAVFIHTQELYSVLRGDLLEATTLSDAVVYGGLVEKNVQTSAFLDSLSFDDSPVEVRYSVPIRSCCCLLFDVLYSQSSYYLYLICYRFRKENDLVSMRYLSSHQYHIFNFWTSS